MRKKTVVIGAGPGGLAAAMILQANGHSVEVFEKHRSPGGRNGRTTLIKEHHFDIGPTFLMMPGAVEEVFAKAGKEAWEHLPSCEIDPMYTLVLPDGKKFRPSRDPEKMQVEMDRCFPGQRKGYIEFLKKEGNKLRLMEPLLKRPFEGPLDLMKTDFLKALPNLDLHLSLYEVISKYIDNEQLKLALTFQSKYLGMSPWKVPGTFSIIPAVEHLEGVHHLRGGINALSRGMEKCLKDDGGIVHYEEEVEKILFDIKGKAIGIKTKNKGEVFADNVICNAPIGHFLKKLADRRHIIEKRSAGNMSWSCSGMMLYLALDDEFNIDHHNIVFAKDYIKNIDWITNSKGPARIPEDFSYYVHNPSITDPHMAPIGRSSIYVLLPCPNLDAGIDWILEAKVARDMLLDKMESQLGMKGIRGKIIAEQIKTPLNWEMDHNVYKGAIFSLQHGPGQMLMLRPKNRMAQGLYMCGGGTHPGSGIPTILNSAIIAADLAMEG